jgi:hypothetical protein
MSDDEEEDEYAVQVQTVKKQFLTDILAAGGLRCVGSKTKGFNRSLAEIRTYRKKVYDRVPYSKLENWLYYWKRIDESAFQDLLRSFDLVPDISVGLTDTTDTMATTTGGPTRATRARANNNNNNNNNAGGGPPPNLAPGFGFRAAAAAGYYVGKFQGESCLLASNLVTHMRALQ